MIYLWVPLIGFFGGIVGGLFGVGGGALYVPLLMMLCGFDIHMAIGTSFAIVLPVALMGGWQNTLSGMMAWKYVPVMAIFALAGAWLGAKLSLGMDALLLRRLFALFLVGVALKLFLTK